MREIRTHDLTRINRKSYRLYHKRLYLVIHGIFVILSKKKDLNFLHKEGEKLLISKKNQYPKYGKNSLNIQAILRAILKMGERGRLSPMPRLVKS